MLVKLPGPRPTTIRPICAGSAISSSIAASRSPAFARRARPTSVAQTAPKDVAVSKARVVFIRDPDAAVRLVDVLEGNDRARPREPGAAVLGPLDEGDRAVEVRLEVAPLLRVEAGEPVEVEMGDRNRRLVAVADREGRARDRLDDPERPAAPRTKVVLPAPSSPETATTSPARSVAARRAAERLGLRRRGGDDVHGETARTGRAGPAVRRAAPAAPARARPRAARPSSSGIRAKSSSSTCSIRGV